MVLKCSRPNQVHQYAKNKSKKCTERLKKIAKKYGLILDDDRNKELLQHKGRQPDAYHIFVLKEMKKVDAIASKAPKNALRKKSKSPF